MRQRNDQRSKANFSSFTVYFPLSFLRKKWPVDRAIEEELGELTSGEWPSNEAGYFRGECL